MISLPQLDGFCVCGILLPTSSEVTGGVFILPVLYLLDAVDFGSSYERLSTHAAKQCRCHEGVSILH